MGRWLGGWAIGWVGGQVGGQVAGWVGGWVGGWWVDGLSVSEQAARARGGKGDATDYIPSSSRHDEHLLALHQLTVCTS